MRRKFYAVTRNSIYLIFYNWKDGRPGAKRIVPKRKGESSPGGTIGRGSRMAIGRHLIMFNPGNGDRCKYADITSVKTCYWGDQISDVVGLFKWKWVAWKCFRSEFLRANDPRFEKQTKAVLTAISENHPAFSVCTEGRLALFPPSSPLVDIK